MRKYIHRIITVFTALLLVITGLTGCGKKEAAEEQTSAQKTSKKEETKEVVFRFANYGPTIKDLKKVESAMNKILVPRIKCRIKLEAIDASNYTKQMGLDLSSGTRIDIAAMADDNYTSSINQNQIVDMTELLDKYGKKTKDIIGEKYLKGVKVNGKIYGLPRENGRANVLQFAMRKDILDKYGISTEGFKEEDDWKDQKNNLELIDKIFSKVKQVEPDVIPLIPSGQGDAQIDEMIKKVPLGNTIGSTIGADSTKVVNIYASKEYASCCDVLRNWYKSGYMMKDVATTTESWKSILASGKGFSTFSVSETGFDSELKNSTGYEFECVRLTKPFITFVKAGYVIPVTAKDPVASMKVLNELYSDKELATLLIFGIKDEHYVITDDGKAAYPDGIVDNTAAYPHSNFWAMPNQLVALDMNGTVKDYNKILTEHNKEAETSKLLGFNFDDSKVQNEIASCSVVSGQYTKGLESGSIDPKNGIKELNEKLKEAGADRIIAEKQKQLDKWLKENN